MLTNSEIENPVEKNKAHANKRKLSYHLQRELDEMPDLIKQLEKERDNLESIISSESFYQKSYEQNQQTLEQLSRIEKKLDVAMNRWVEIENKAKVE